MWRIVIAGGHGQIALELQRLLAGESTEVVALIRNPDHAADVRAAGGIPVVANLEDIDLDDLTTILQGADAVVFAAGAGPGSGSERKNTMDRDGAILFAAAAELAGARRFVMVSAHSADRFDPDSDDVFQIYLRAKSDADHTIMRGGLDWTILRPGSLTDEPGTGRVRLGTTTERGSIPRQDVAAVIVAVLDEPDTAGTLAEFISGDTPIPEAVASMVGSTPPDPLS